MEVLGIDIGGTGIKGAIVNVESGELITERYRIPTPTGAKPADVANEVAAMVKHFNWKGVVGCGFPTIISNGKAKSFGNIDPSWVGVQVDELFSERTGLEFYIANDADAAGLAEIKLGAGKDVSGVVILITIGSGLGSGVFVDGKLVPNVELGIVGYKEYERFEFYASDAARKREGISYKIWGKRFKKFLDFVVRTFSPDLIIIGGGASKKIDKFKEALEVGTPVIPAKYKNNAGIIGAAMIAVQ
ncbi:ROK family protein [Flavicella sp.]|uniref:polyphosphate--glucose phosphotransferase n=1 Tax=Flavicella sp. TaxID=2957742 RepID=UPI003017824C